jgi:predicted transcriptional regulator
MVLKKPVYHPKNQPLLPDGKPVVPLEEAFKEDEIICMICGQGGMKTLARHLNFVHNLKPGQYRKLFGLKRDKLLTSKKYSEERRRFAEEKVSPKMIAKARAALLAKVRGESSTSTPSTPSTRKRAYRKLHNWLDEVEQDTGTH